MPSLPNVIALIVAGGTGTRMGARQPKQFLPLGGKTVLRRTIERFALMEQVHHVVVVTHPDFRKRTQDILERTLALIPEVRGSAIDGGAERTDSVRNGLTALADASHQAGGGGERILVAIHDGVRPLIRQTRIMAAVASAAEHGSGVCAVPVKSSLREKRADGSSHAIDRSSIYHVQTPQIFRLPEILHAYAKTEGQIFTDDASVFEAAGYPVHIVPGDYDNLKITTPEDLILAEQYLDLQRKG